MELLRMKFKDFCHQNDIKVLRDDFVFLKRTIRAIPEEKRAEVMHEYTRIWIQVKLACCDKVRAQNEGRRAANNWIRELAC